MPNNRQWAFIFWTAVLLGWALTRADVRSSIREVFRTAASPKILVPLAILAGWVVGLVYLAADVELWDEDRTTDTGMWFITAGLVLFGGFDKVSKERHFVRRSAIATLKASAMVQVFAEVFVLSLIAEVVAQPFLALLGGLSVVAAQKAEHAQAKKLVDGLIAVASAGLLLYVAGSAISNWGTLDKADVAQQLALPVWLTIGVLPYIYCLGLFSAYELAFLRVNWKSQAGWWARMRVRVALMTSFHVKAREVGSFSGSWQSKLARSSSFRDSRRVIAEFKRAQRSAEFKASQKRADLLRFSGVEGDDEAGRRLDQREFQETTEVLRWIANCQMGWYRNNGADRYRQDLLDFVLDGTAGRKLPNPHGVELRVSKDGQKWFATRRTIGGWVFAIGASGPPPNQWEFDGADPPQGFPGDDSAWGTGPFMQDVNVNW